MRVPGSTERSTGATRKEGQDRNERCDGERKSIMKEYGGKGVQS